jgi:hypothetical protein
VNQASQERGDESRVARADFWLEVVAAVLLALAAVATAWSGYQASRWNGEAAIASGHTRKAQIGATRAQGLAEAEEGADLATFTQWVDAYLLDRPEVRNFYFRRFRKEFKPAVVAWIATRPLKIGTPRCHRSQCRSTG